MHENAWSLGYTSATFKLSSPGILYRWQQDFDAYGLSGLHPKPKGRKVKHKAVGKQTKSIQAMTDKELREELEYLRTENAVLKKLEALAQQKRTQTKKKS
jgi:transposase